jgi:glucose uptake protein
MTFFYSILVIFALGTWIAVVQTIPFKNQQIKILYISVANLILAFGVALYQDGPLLQSSEFIFPFAGGILWAVSGYFALLGTENIGLAKAQGIWAPINIIISIFWGMILFGEFLTLSPVKIVVVLIAVGSIIIGILFIVTAGDAKKTTDSGLKKNVRIGYIGALVAGVLWGSYFIPIRISGSSMWAACFPMAIGIFCGSLLLFLMSRESLILRNASDYIRVFMSGVLWGVGNYASLKLMELIGTGKGFTISQVAIVLAAVYSVFLFKNPPFKTRGAFFVFTGIVLSVIGSIILGNIS